MGMKQPDEKGSFCPLIQGDCKGNECMWSLKVQGSDPQTGDPINKWDCAIAWMPVFQMETSKEVRQGAAATESLRNEIVAYGETKIQRVRFSDAGEAIPNQISIPHD